MEVYFDEYLLKNPSAKGKRIAARVVRKVADSTGKAAPRPQRQNMPLLDLVAASKDGDQQEGRPEEEEGKEKE